MNRSELNMITEHKLTLLANAVDSLNEALKKYQEGVAGETKSFKFCILHLAHFFELILKHYVALSHPLLIYTKPFTKDLKKGEAHTITLEDAMNFLKNEGNVVSADFEKDLLWLKKLRNDIEHHAFSMDVDEVTRTVGRLIFAVHRFDADHKKIGLSQFIDNGNYEAFNQLAITYEERLRLAIEAVQTAETEAYRGLRHKEFGLANFNVYRCDECGHDTLIPNANSSTFYRCTFCSNEESDEIEVQCGVCDDEWTMGDMGYMDYHDDGRKIYVCPRCAGDPDYQRD